MKFKPQHSAHAGHHADTRMLIFLIGGSVAISFILTVTYGSLFSTIAIIGLLATIVLTFYRLDWGFFLFVGMVLAFDQFPPRGYETSIIEAISSGVLLPHPSISIERSRVTLYIFIVLDHIINPMHLNVIVRIIKSATLSGLKTL